MKPTSPVESQENQKETLSSLCASMYDAMLKVGGVGLAANQVGVDMSLFVARINNQPYYFINPEILEEMGNYVKPSSVEMPEFEGTADALEKLTIRKSA